MKRRYLPRHVDGRTMILMMPIKKFIVITLLFLIPSLIYFITHLNPLIMVGLLIFNGTIIILNMEFNNRETGFDLLKDMIKYLIQGDIVYERSCRVLDDSERFIQNKKVEEIRRKKSSTSTD